MVRKSKWWGSALAMILVASVTAADQGPKPSPAGPAKHKPAGKAAASPAAPKPAASPSPASAAEQALRARVAEYWKVRQTTNLQSAYVFYEPAFRKQYTPDTFSRDFRRLNRFAPEFQGVEDVKIDPPGTHATVKIKLKTKPDILGGQDLVSVTEEAWVFVDNEWWKASEPTLPSL